MSFRVGVIAITSCCFVGIAAVSLSGADKRKNKKRKEDTAKLVDAKNSETGKPPRSRDPEFEQYGIYAKTAPRAETVEPMVTELPLRLNKGDRIALIGNALFERSQFFGYFESLIHQQFPEHQLVVRNLAWSADTPDIQPRPANFADLEQHLKHERIDVIFAAFGFNESFAGQTGLDSFKESLSSFAASIKSKAFDGDTAPRIILVSPIASENVETVSAADLNNDRLQLYVDAVQEVALQQQVGYVDVFATTKKAMESLGSDLTINGVHLNEAGYELFSKDLFRETIGQPAPEVNELLRQVVIDKNRQYNRRYRPVNTFYYTGDRSKSYGYLDFLPAMRNFDIMAANRDAKIWQIAQGKSTSTDIDDSNVPPLPLTQESRGANEWITAAEELKAFQVDSRFEVNLFAGEEEFPDLAAPIQMRWDAAGRLWVSCSTTYPHVYPGNEPDDKIVVLEDVDGDGEADKSTVFAEGLHIPLSFQFGDGGVYVSEQPDLTFLKDTDGDGKADLRRRVLTGFGTEDSHHSLHDFAWTPDGDLIFRESIFHHSQVETPYGPVRQQNSGWFRFEPRSRRLTSFGTYHSTNPWGVTFDDWGQHVASRPIYAAAFHSLDPPYPQQHPKPVWAYRNVDAVNADLLRETLACDDHHARAAATQQLRYWHTHMPDAIDLLRTSVNDSSGIVRMEAVIAASYIGTSDALDAALDVFLRPHDQHLTYAITCALGSHTLRRHWENDPSYDVAKQLKRASRQQVLKEPTPSAAEAEFDTQKNLKVVRIGCMPERMRYTVSQFAVTTSQPVKIVFSNPDATDHNLLIVQPGALEEVGMAANAMAKDPKNANSDFLPEEKRSLIIEACPMIGPTRKTQVHVLRFQAPPEPGIYPFVCTFPGHWVVMKGDMVVAEDLADVEAMLAAQKPTIVKEWTLADFAALDIKHDEQAVMRGMQAFEKARCNQCHVVAGHGISLGPDLTDVSKRLKGEKLLKQILEPSSEINEKYKTYQFLLNDGKLVSGVIAKEDEADYHVITNLLIPHVVTKVRKRNIDEKIASKISAMPPGMANVLTADEIKNLVTFLEAGGYKLPGHLQHHHEQE